MKSCKSGIVQVCILIPIVISILAGCSGVQPTAKATPSEGPTIDQAQKEDYMGPKARVAVTRFSDKSAKGGGQFGDGMTEMLANALFATNRYIVLERQSLGDVIAEQDLGASGRIKQETAPRIGEIEGADILVEGTITEFEPGSAGGGGGLGGLLPGKAGTVASLLGGIKTSHVALIVKMIDTKTGRRLASEQVEGKATDIGGGLNIGGTKLAGAFSAFSNTPMEKAIRVAIHEAVKAVVAKTPSQFYRYGAKPQATPVTTPPSTSLPQATTVTTPQSSQRITQVIIDIENLRDSPGGKIIGKVKKGTTLAILGEKGNWLNIRLEDGTAAWIWKASTTEGTKR